MSHMHKLKELAAFNGGQRDTVGLPPASIERFLRTDGRLSRAIDDAAVLHACLPSELKALLRLPEREQITELQAGFINFYGPDAVNPYVPLAASGPWIVTTCGAVVHDSGGYGMLGQGHNPDAILGVMGSREVMANIMTASLAHRELVDCLRAEIGHTRPGALRNPYEAFLCLNSGSESVTFAFRISDTNALLETSPGSRHAGKPIKLLAFRGGFHGRTDRPSQASDSCLATYKKHLASFRDRDNLITIAPNAINELEEVFARADREGFFIEAMLMEPVMGEGNPGLGLDPAFYKRARELTAAHGSILVVDSIQAGIRAHGVLSVMDYPGFRELDPPDLETYSKAVNAGQYPLSVVAFSSRAARLYIRGTYGNTMTANPRALHVACAVLKGLTPELRQNIIDRGHEFLTKLSLLQKEFPEDIELVQGTGLLFCVALNPRTFKVVGRGCFEEHLRMQGIGVIHGGTNALRFTPPFDVTSAEVDLIVEGLRQGLKVGPRLPS
jgi:acetylornithine/succinyldiaminopimelate/putrescine aminotransferase